MIRARSVTHQNKGEIVIKIIIDRFEDEQAVVELPARIIKKIDRHLLPSEAKEGDVIDISIDKNDKRKKEIDSLTTEIWGD